jgi:hypothetical protein
MISRALIPLGLLAVVAIIAWCWWRNAGFTPWMSKASLDQYLSQYDTTPPGGHPNYWDKGHWFNAVEGRWTNEGPQFRIRYGPTPKGVRYLWWYWDHDEDEKAFQTGSKRLAAEGFVLLDPNYFTRPDGTRHYQAVWQKVVR